MKSQNCGKWPLALYRSPFTSLHLWVWGKEYLKYKVCKVSTIQKAFVIVTWWGAGIHFPHVLPISSTRPLAPPRSLKELYCPLLSQLPPSSQAMKTIWLKKNSKKRVTSCPFVWFLGQRGCLLHSSAWFHRPYTWALFDGKTLYFHKHRAELCRSQSLTNCLQRGAQISCGFKWVTL